MAVACFLFLEGRRDNGLMALGGESTFASLETLDVELDLVRGETDGLDDDCVAFFEGVMHTSDSIRCMSDEFEFEVASLFLFIIVGIMFRMLFKKNTHYFFYHNCKLFDDRAKIFFLLSKHACPEKRGSAHGG